MINQVDNFTSDIVEIQRHLIRQVLLYQRTNARNDLTCAMTIGGNIFKRLTQLDQFGFLVLNVALVTFGTWCYLVPVLRRWPSAKGITLGWSLVELVNGVGHPLWSLRQGGYTPGVVTAPVLLVLSLVVFSQLRKQGDSVAVG